MPIDSSKFFDSIRVKPRGKQPEVKPRDTVVGCEWTGCQNKGAHRAPKGRDNQREYWHFCLDHVREYNQNYNFFSGMNADAVARYQKDALTGHRPTWKMGANGSPGKGKGGPAPPGWGGCRRSVQRVLRTQRPRPLAARTGR